jgi:hypothetical protein
MTSNTANDQTPAPTPTVRYAALATGPYVTTITNSTYANQVDAIDEVVGLMGHDEVYSVVVAKVTVQPRENSEPTIAINMAEYDGDEAARLIRS